MQCNAKRKEKEKLLLLLVAFLQFAHAIVVERTNHRIGERTSQKTRRPCCRRRTVRPVHWLAERVATESVWLSVCQPATAATTAAASTTTTTTTTSTARQTTNDANKGLRNQLYPPHLTLCLQNHLKGFLELEPRNVRRQSACLCEQRVTYSI